MCLFVCVCVFVCVYVFVCLCVCLCVCHVSICVCQYVFRNTYMHTWQSGAIFGFFLLVLKIVKLLYAISFPTGLLCMGLNSSEIFVQIIMKFVSPTLPPMLQFCLVNCLVYWYVN